MIFRATIDCLRVIGSNGDLMFTGFDHELIGIYIPKKGIRNDGGMTINAISHIFNGWLYTHYIPLHTHDMYNIHIYKYYKYYPILYYYIILCIYIYVYVGLDSHDINPFRIG